MTIDLDSEAAKEQVAEAKEQLRTDLARLSQPGLISLEEGSPTGKALRNVLSARFDESLQQSFLNGGGTTLDNIKYFSQPITGDPNMFATPETTTDGNTDGLEIDLTPYTEPWNDEELMQIDSPGVIVGTHPRSGQKAPSKNSICWKCRHHATAHLRTTVPGSPDSRLQTTTHCPFDYVTGMIDVAGNLASCSGYQDKDAPAQEPAERVRLDEWDLIEI